MPALILCGNPTFVAGDDLRTFTFFAILLRVIQLIALIALTKIVSGQFRFEGSPTEQCDGSGRVETWVEKSAIVFTTYFVSSYITAIVGLLLEVGIWRTSAKGTPVETRKRARLRPLCYVKLVPLSAFRIANMVMGVMIMKILRQVCWCGQFPDANPYIICPRLVELRVWLAILIGSHFTEAVIVGLTGLYFLFKSSNRQLPPMVSAESKWRCCCQCCCTVTSLLTCCLYGGRDGNTKDFADIAVILADYFDSDGTLDVVASDIVLGLRMLARVQRQTQAECRVDLKRRASFVASMKAGTASTTRANLDLLKQELDLPEEVEGNPERMRLVKFQDEEMGEATGMDRVDENEKLGASTNQGQHESETDEETEKSMDALEMEEKGSWTGHIHLKDEEVGEEIVVENPSTTELPTASPEAPKNSVIPDDDLQVTDEIAALLKDEEDHDDEDIVLKRVGSEKKIRRKAVVYNLHQTGGVIHYEPAVRQVLSRKDAIDKLAIAEGARYIRFSMGIYFFRRYNTQQRSCELCCAVGEKATACMNKCRTKTNEMAGHELLDHRVGYGYRIGDILESRFLSLAGLEQAEIEYVQFGEGVARTPYCIAIDHAWNSIVVVIRGTEGLDDVVADLRMVPVSMAQCGSQRGFNGQDYFVHAGMFECAQWINDDLQSHGIVDKLLAEPRHEGYTLRLTGHSLGAGTAAILSFMIRHKYPGLKVSCFCPPGCSVSANMAEECKDYLTSYVLDHDIVPRMSVGSLENLRNGMLNMISRLKVTKFQATHAKPLVDKDMLLHRQDSIPPSKFKEQLDEFQERRGEAIALRSTRAVPLYPPGKIVQLVETADDTPPAGCCSSSAATEAQDTPYMARWAHVEDLSEIIISSHFLDDHSTVNVLRELERTAGVFGLSSPTFTVQEETTETRVSPRRASLWRNRK